MDIKSELWGPKRPEQYWESPPEKCILNSVINSAYPSFEDERSFIKVRAKGGKEYATLVNAANGEEFEFLILCSNDTAAYLNSADEGMVGIAKDCRLSILQETYPDSRVVAFTATLKCSNAEDVWARCFLATPSALDVEVIPDSLKIGTGQDLAKYDSPDGENNLFTEDGIIVSYSVDHVGQIPGEKGCCISFSVKVVKASYKGNSTLLQRGQRFNLAAKTNNLSKLAVTVGWTKKNQSDHIDIDLSVFMTGTDKKCSSEDEFVFYGNREHKSKSVRIVDVEFPSDGDREEVQVDTLSLPEGVEALAFSLTIYEPEERCQNFGFLSNIYCRVIDLVTSSELVRFQMEDAFNSETAIVLGELYNKGGAWRFNAIGSGFNGGLAALCRSYGIEVE